MPSLGDWRDNDTPEMGDVGGKGGLGGENKFSLGFGDAYGISRCCYPVGICITNLNPREEIWAGDRDLEDTIGEP